MTASSIGFFTALLCISAVTGALIGIVCRGRVIITVVAAIVVSVAFFVFLEWKFGSPEEWSWHDPLTSAAYLVGPFGYLIGAPMVLAALFVGRWCMRSKVI
jgi:hypothetical protein